jgi:hypothetical protein
MQSNAAAAPPTPADPSAASRLHHAQPLFPPPQFLTSSPPHQIGRRRPNLANEMGASAQEPWKRGGLARWLARALLGWCAESRATEGCHTRSGAWSVSSDSALFGGLRWAADSGHRCSPDSTGDVLRLAVFAGRPTTGMPRMRRI